MPAVTLIRDVQTGKLVGLSDADQRAYSRFLKRIQELAGSCLRFEWREPRSGPFHRRFFAMVGAAFACQEQFADVDQFRMWLEVGAGHGDFVPGPTGRMVAMPRSIGYAKLDQVEFQAVSDAVWAFYRSEHARRFLWPHLSDEQSWSMVEAVMGEFE